MAKPKRLSKKTLQEDREAYAALQAIADYNPSNQDYKLPNITASFQAMETDQTAEVQKKAAADAASDKAADSEYKFHNDMLGAKAQIRAQYGNDSNEVQSVGLKKKSEYLTGRRTNKSGSDTTP